MALATVVRAIDQTPLSSFSYNGQRLTDAVVRVVTPSGVQISGKDARGDRANITVPLSDAAKMPGLRMRAKNEIQAAIEKADAARDAAASPAAPEIGQEQAFDMVKKVPDGWIVYVCKTYVSDNSPSTSGLASVGGGGMVLVSTPKTNWVEGAQLALLSAYGKEVAEGERIVTRVEKGATQEIQFKGGTKTLRVFNVVGEDRVEGDSASSP